SHSGNSRTSSPLSNSRRHAPSGVMTMPNPSTAAAIAPKLALIVNLPSTWSEVAVSPLREDQRPCENSPHRRRRVGKRTKPKRDVHAFGHEVFALISHHQVDPQRRMPAHEVRKPGDDLPHRKGRRQTDPQYSAQLSRSARGVFRLVE